MVVVFLVVCFVDVCCPTKARPRKAGLFHLCRENHHEAVSASNHLGMTEGHAVVLERFWGTFVNLP